MNMQIGEISTAKACSHKTNKKAFKINSRIKIPIIQLYILRQSYWCSFIFFKFQLLKKIIVFYSKVRKLRFFGTFDNNLNN